MLNRTLRMIGIFLVVLLLGSSALAQSLKVCATVPELGSLAREIGGERVTVVTFAKGTEDPHFLEAKPSFIKSLSECDAYIQIGMDLEIGWAPVLLRESRNGNVLAGARGHINASTAITPREVPTVAVDRSMGDVHPFGNPHYLLDPLNGLRVAGLIRERFSEIQPASQQYFTDRYTSFRQRLGNALVGESLAKKYDIEKLAALFEHGKLDDFLKSHNEQGLLGGWFALLQPHHGAKLVADHNMWPYFAERYGLSLVGTLEPKPGIPPTTAHLGEIVDVMKANNVRAVLATAYYDIRYADFVSQNTGAKVVPMAHQAGARPGTDEYLNMADYNVRQLAAALGSVK
ncbi:MAG: zinc ABC transporter substrate-binding protein [Deltaproteobacteria bacterium]|nr:zinc ABC transporter substrate-binding protein [Deltaproteobacteria bacterium]